MLSELVKSSKKKDIYSQLLQSSWPTGLYDGSQMVPIPSLPDSLKPGLQGPVGKESNFKSNSLLEATRAFS